MMFADFQDSVYPSFFEPDSRSNLSSSSHVGWVKITASTAHATLWNLKYEYEPFQTSIQHIKLCDFFGIGHLTLHGLSVLALPLEDFSSVS